MEKKYYADIHSYVCPACRQQVFDKIYFGVFETKEIGAAKRAGVFKYKCPHCKAERLSSQFMTNGGLQEVSAKEAQSSGLLVFDSPGRLS